MMLNLPIHEHGMCFHLVVSSSIYFFSALSFSRYRSFTSLVRFIPRYFFLFEATVKGIVFLISLSVSSLLAYRNATDFWILIFYPATLLNSFISLVVSHQNLWGCLCTVSCQLQIMTVLLLAFQFRCLLFLLTVCFLWLELPVLY